MTYFPTHTHSAFSTMDGMQPVPLIVDRVADLGMPAVSLTDHATMGGVVQGYKQAKKRGLAFFPGEEFYLVRDVNDEATRGNRWHIGMMALDFEGYQAMVRLTTLSHKPERFYYKALIDLSDLAALHDSGAAKHIAVTTGCYSGIVVNGWQGPKPKQHASNMIAMLARWFPNLYVELQNHNIKWPEGHTDADIADFLYKEAQRVGLPVIVGADSHYLDASEQPVHDLMKDICYFGAGEDSHFNGGPYGIESWDTMRSQWPTKWESDILAGHQALLDSNRVTIPAIDNYKFRVPAMKKNPDKVLRKLVMQGLDALGLQTLDYLGRADDELKVISAMAMSNYFLLVKTHVTDWCRDNGVIVNTRGSANGSLVCYALGITTVDPLQWNTSFPRFLSLERMKPPDIDVDVDFEARQKLLAHLHTIYPSSVQIGTYQKIGMGKNKDTGEDSGSVLVQYMAAFRRKDPNFDGKVKKEHWDTLTRLSDETLVWKGMGTHAAGVILPGEGLPIADYLPLGRIPKSDNVVTQYNKDDVEALGYTKIDVLGLRALQTLNGCLKLIGKPLNDWKWIPFDDPRACGALRSGNGVGLFQFEGWSTARGGKEVGIRSTHDAILTQALYRPALTNGGQKDLYLYNRANKKNQMRLHPLFDPIVADTMGVPLFQEQIMEILQAIGMPFKEYNELMGAIKASNGYIAAAIKTFDRLMPMFYDLCELKGLDADASDDAWDAVIGFTDYGFNRAHATSYGIMAYYSAYLKAHYPLEYMASLLSVWAEEPDKVSSYVGEARAMGFSIVKADVNYSDVSWNIEQSRSKAIRKGLISLPGIGIPTAKIIVEEREKNGPYSDVQDFLNRTPRRPVTAGTQWKSKGVLIGVAKTLMESGAFRSMGA